MYGQPGGKQAWCERSGEGLVDSRWQGGQHSAGSGAGGRVQRQAGVQRVNMNDWLDSNALSNDDWLHDETEAASRQQQRQQWTSRHHTGSHWSSLASPQARALH